MKINLVMILLGALFVINFVSATDISSCRANNSIDYSNGSYVLTSDVISSSGEVCFSLTGNTIFDCNNFKVNLSAVQGTEGFTVSGNNNTIKNCIIYNSEFRGDTCFGVNVGSANNTLLDNVTFYNLTHSVYGWSEGYNYTIQNTNIYNSQNAFTGLAGNNFIFKKGYFEFNCSNYIGFGCGMFRSYSSLNNNFTIEDSVVSGAISNNGYDNPFFTLLNVTQTSPNYLSGLNIINNYRLNLSIKDSNNSFLNASNITYGYVNGTVFSELSDINGRGTATKLTEYIQNSSGVFYSSPVWINISKNNYISNNTQYNLTFLQNLNLNIVLNLANMDNTSPLITSFYPLGILDYTLKSTNLSLNYSINDTNLDSCWYSYNNINTTLNCSSNTTFLHILNNNNLTLWANDTFGNTNFSFVIWTFSNTPTTGGGLSHSSSLENTSVNYSQMCKDIYYFEIYHITSNGSIVYAISDLNSILNVVNTHQIINLNSSFIQPFVDDFTKCYKYSDLRLPSFENATQVQQVYSNPSCVTDPKSNIFSYSIPFFQVYRGYLSCDSINYQKLFFQYKFENGAYSFQGIRIWFLLAIALVITLIVIGRRK